jgi:hypothetical protein
MGEACPIMIGMALREEVQPGGPRTRAGKVDKVEQEAQIPVDNLLTPES